MKFWVGDITYQQGEGNSKKQQIKYQNNFKIFQLMITISKERSDVKF
jgi:hypothetical protein